MLLGFHAHNGLENANAKAIAAWRAGAVYIDGCMGGFGRGPGNAQTEFLVRYWKTGDCGPMDRMVRTSYQNTLSSEEKHIFAEAACQQIHPEYANFASKFLFDQDFTPTMFFDLLRKSGKHQSFSSKVAESLRETVCHASQESS